MRDLRDYPPTDRHQAHAPVPTRDQLDKYLLRWFFDAADDHVEKAAGSRRKGWLVSFRDATLFKVVYGWGLRRREAAMLDVADFAPNPAAPELGSFGVCHVRYGKAMRGSPPRRRAVATVMPWAAGALAQYLDEVRPGFGVPSHPALWLTERGVMALCEVPQSCSLNFPTLGDAPVEIVPVGGGSPDAASVCSSSASGELTSNAHTGGSRGSTGTA